MGNRKRKRNWTSCLQEPSWGSWFRGSMDLQWQYGLAVHTGNEGGIVPSEQSAAKGTAGLGHGAVLGTCRSWAVLCSDELKVNDVCSIIKKGIAYGKWNLHITSDKLGCARVKVSVSCCISLLRVCKLLSLVIKTYFHYTLLDWRDLKQQCQNTQVVLYVWHSAWKWHWLILCVLTWST